MNQKTIQTETVIIARGNKGQVTISPAYSGGLMRVADGRHVVIDLDGLEAGESTPLLLDHDESNEVGVGRATVEAGQLNIRGQIQLKSPLGSELIEDSKSKQLKASVGVTIIEAEMMEAGTLVNVNGQSFKPTVDFLLVTKSKLREISLLEEPADRSTRVQIAASKHNEDSMSIENQPVQNEDQTEQLLELFASEDAAELTTEDIAGLKTDLQSGRLDLVTANNRIKLTAKLNELDRKGGITGPSIRAGTANMSQDILTAAILKKGGHHDIAEKSYGDEILCAADPLSRKTLCELSAVALKMDGQKVPSSKSDLFASSVGISTMSLPVALSDSIHKSVLQLLGMSPATWQSISAKRTATDFHVHNELRPTALGEMEPLAPDGEIKHGRLTETVFPWKVETFARMLTVTRTDWIQDSSGFLQAIPQTFARMFAKKTASLFWTMVLGNGGSFFSNGNNNYLGSTALSIDGVAEAIALMRNQVDVNGDNLDIRPVTLVVQPNQEALAKSILRSLEVYRDPTSGLPTGNPIAGALELEVEPRIENTAKYPNASLTRWYAFAGPMDMPTIVADGPEMARIDFLDLLSDPNKLAIGWRGYYDKGVAFGEPRAAIMSDGA